MAILDQIRQMKREGVAEQEIITRLQEQGIAPQAITDALSQAQIKNAVEGGEMARQETFKPGFPAPQPTAPNPPAPYYPPQEQYPSTEYAPQEGYEENYGGGGTDVMIEVAEQVFEEKTKKIGKQLGDLKEFSTLAGAKLSNFEERLKKIETIIDNLQIKILEKIGSYGQGMETIKKEMSMMQNSFTKMIPELAKKQVPAKKAIAKKKVTKKKISKKK